MQLVVTSRANYLRKNPGTNHLPKHPMQWTDPSKLQLIEEDSSKELIDFRLIESIWKVVELNNLFQT